MPKVPKTTPTLDDDLAVVLRRMEERGVKLDVGYLEGVATDLRDQLTSLEEQIYDAVGHQFAINSPKQLSAVLFGELHLGDADGVRLKKKAMGFSTAAKELEQFRGTHPVIDHILKYREVGKLLSTYVEPLPQLVDGEGRLHTHYAPDAASGRLSSRKPNLQNIPIRTELGRTIRQAFIADTGKTLLSADYSQLQLRIIADMAKDEAMLAVFRDGGDIHTQTATSLGIDRRAAKAVNFGIIYGLTSYGLSESLGVSREEAQKIIDGYLATYPAVARYMQQLIKDAEAQGYATTMFGKQRPLPELHSHNDFIRKAAERIAINHPIQGTEAEIMKRAMIAVDKKLANSPKVAMILQVHDELVFELAEKDVADVLPIVKELMEKTTQLSVPLIVDFKLGTNWAEMRPLNERQ